MRSVKTAWGQRSRGVDVDLLLRFEEFVTALGKAVVAEKEGISE